MVFPGALPVPFPISPPGVDLLAVEAGDVADGIAGVDERQPGEPQHDPGVRRLERAPLAAERVAVDRDLLAPAERLPEVDPQVEDSPLAGTDPVGALDP